MSDIAIVEDDDVNPEIDETCFMCGPHIPALPEGVDPKEYYYIFGFANGIVTAMRSEGPVYCPRHTTAIRAMLLERGVNWGKPERKLKL